MASELEVGKIKAGDGTTTAIAGADDVIIAQSSNDAGVTIRTATSSTGQICFADGNTGNEAYRGFIGYAHGTDKLNLGSGGSTRLTIDSSGDVSVGIGNSKEATIQSTNSGRVEGNPAYSFRGDLDTGMFNPNTDNTLAFATGGTERMRISSTGQVTVNESVAIGTSPTSGISLNVRENSTTTAADIRNANASGFGLYVAGGSSSSEYAFRAANKDNTALFTVRGDGLAEFSNGINLGNETMSSYQTGVWYPHLYYQNPAGVTIGGTAYALQAVSDYTEMYGHYVKVGKLVHVEGYLKVTTANTSSFANDNIGIQGLPFTHRNATDANAMLMVNTTGASGSIASGVVAPNGTIAVLQTSSGGSNLADDIGAVTNLQIWISGTYFSET